MRSQKEPLASNTTAKTCEMNVAMSRQLQLISSMSLMVITTAVFWMIF